MQRLWQARAAGGVISGATATVQATEPPLDGHLTRFQIPLSGREDRRGGGQGLLPRTPFLTRAPTHFSAGCCKLLSSKGGLMLCAFLVESPGTVPSTPSPQRDRHPASVMSTQGPVHSGHVRQNLGRCFRSQTLLLSSCFSLCVDSPSSALSPAGQTGHRLPLRASLPTSGSLLRVPRPGGHSPTCWA